MLKSKKLDEIVKKWSVLDKITALLLLCLVVLFSYLQLTRSSIYEFDSDNVVEIYFRLISFQQKSFFPEGFYCSHEPFASRLIILYWIFYGLTGNFLLSHHLEVIVTSVLNLMLAFILLKSVKVRRSICFLALSLLWIGTADGVRRVVLYPSNGYDLFVLSALAILILRLKIIKILSPSATVEEIKKCVFPIIGLLLICGFIGYTSVRPLLTICVPLLCIDGIKVVWRFINHRKVSKKLLFQVAIGAALTFINALAYYLLLLSHGETFTPLSVNIAEPATWVSWEVIETKLQSLLSVCNLIGGASISSLMGIKTLLHFALFFLYALAIIWLWKKKKNEADALDVDVFLFWISTTLITLSYEIVTAVITRNDRYYYLTGILLPILLAMAMENWCSKKDYRQAQIPVCCVLLGTMVLSVFTVVSYKEQYQDTNVPPVYQVSQYLEEQDYVYVTGSYWNSCVIRGYSNNQIGAQHIADFENMQPVYWMAYEKDFTNSKKGEKCAVILTDEEEKDVLNGNGILKQILIQESEKDTELLGYNIYTLYENPYCIAERLREKYSADLPTEKGGKRTVYPDATGFVGQFGQLTEQRAWLTDGTGGMVLYGPYQDTVAGVYKVTLHYTVDENPQNGYGTFDICSSDGRQYICEFGPETHTVTIDNIEFQDGYVFESRVTVPDGMVMRIESLEYERMS